MEWLAAIGNVWPLRGKGRSRHDLHVLETSYGKGKGRGARGPSCVFFLPQDGRIVFCPKGKKGRWEFEDRSWKGEIMMPGVDEVWAQVGVNLRGSPRIWDIWSPHVRQPSLETMSRDSQATEYRHNGVHAIFSFL